MSTYRIISRDEMNVVVEFLQDGFVTCDDDTLVRVKTGDKLLFEHGEKWTFEGVTHG